MIKKNCRIFLIFISAGLIQGCERSVELFKFSNQIELFGFGGEVDQAALVKEKTLPSFTGREDNFDISSSNFSSLLPDSVEKKSLEHFFDDVREALLLKRELFEGKLKVIEKDAEVQATFSDYSPQLKLGTTNNYVLYDQGENSSSEANKQEDEKNNE